MRMALVWDCIDLGAYVFWAAIYAPHVETLDQSSFYIINGGVIAVGAWLLFRSCLCRPGHAVQDRVFIPERTHQAPREINFGPNGPTRWQPERDDPVFYPSRYETNSTDKGAPDDLPIEALRAEDGDRFASLRGVDGVAPRGAEEDEKATKFRTAQRQAMDKHRKDSLRFFAQHLYAELLFDLVQSAVIAWMMKEVQMKDKHFDLKLLADFLNIATTFVDVAMIKGPTAAAVTQCNPAEMKKALEGELAPLAKEGGLNYE